jgi:hypothetical protein
VGPLAFFLATLDGPLRLDSLGSQEPLRLDSLGSQEPRSMNSLGSHRSLGSVGGPLSLGPLEPLRLVPLDGDGCLGDACRATFGSLG